MEGINSKLSRFFRKKSVKYGIPFILLVVGGSFGLQSFTELRYRFRRRQPMTADEAEKYSIVMKKPGEVTLETEFEKIKKIDIEHWENKRGPRPWEEGSSSNAESPSTAAAPKNQ